MNGVARSHKLTGWFGVFAFGLGLCLLLLVPTYLFVRLHTQLIDTDYFSTVHPATDQDHVKIKVKQAIQVDNDNGHAWSWEGAISLFGGYPLFFLYPLFLAFGINRYANTLLQDATYIGSIGFSGKQQRVLSHVFSVAYLARYWIFGLLGLLPALVVGDFFAVTAVSYSWEVGYSPIPLALISSNLVGSSFFALAMAGGILFCIVIASVLPLWLQKMKALIVSLLVALSLNTFYWNVFVFSTLPGLPSYDQLFMKGRDNLVFLWSDVQFPQLIAFTLAPYALIFIVLVLAAWLESRKSRAKGYLVE